jgi:hypothetical protein
MENIKISDKYILNVQWLKTPAFRGWRWLPVYISIRFECPHASILRRRHCDISKRRKAYVERHSVTSRKDSTLSSTAVKRKISGLKSNGNYVHHPLRLLMNSVCFDDLLCVVLGMQSGYLL